jgi:hypothetical protein
MAQELSVLIPIESVPVEVTDEMAAAGAREFLECRGLEVVTPEEAATLIFRAMVASLHPRRSLETAS